MFKLEFTLDNAVFDNAMATEIAGILREIARDVRNGKLPPGKIIDPNGNVIGKWDIVRCAFARALADAEKTVFDLNNTACVEDNDAILASWGGSA